MAILYTQNLSKAPVLMIQPQFYLAKSLPPQPVPQIQYDPVGLPRNLAPKHCVDSMVYARYNELVNGDYNG